VGDQVAILNEELRVDGVNRTDLCRVRPFVDRNRLKLLLDEDIGITIGVDVGEDAEPELEVPGERNPGGVQEHTLEVPPLRIDHRVRDRGGSGSGDVDPLRDFRFGSRRRRGQ
jgi:hypothetical protein